MSAKCRVFVQASMYQSPAFDLHCAGFKQYIFHQCVFRVRHLITNDFQCWISVIEPEIYLRWFGPVHCGARGDTQCGPELWNRHIYVNHHDQKYLFIFFFYYLNSCCSFVVWCHVMLAKKYLKLNWFKIEYFLGVLMHMGYEAWHKP